MYKWARNNERNGVARTGPILYVDIVVLHILPAPIWPSECQIESVITQNIAITSYTDPQNQNLS